MDNVAPYILLLLLALVTGTSGNDFAGGLMTYYPKGQDVKGFFQVDLHFKENFLGPCKLRSNWSCFSGDCGEIISEDIREVFMGSETCQSEGILTVNLSTNSAFELRNTGCCWVDNVHLGPDDWNLLTYLDLGIRSDTGAPNRPPVITIPPVVSVPKDCGRTIKLLNHDPDGDEVRCKFATEDCEVCASHPNFVLDEETCELHYLGNATIGNHVFEMVMEDYPRETITLCYTDGNHTVKYPLPGQSPAPLIPGTPIPFPTTAHKRPGTPVSKLPLNFVVTVKPALNNCREGIFLPVLVTPSPEDGEILAATAGSPLEIHISAEVTQAMISGFVISGPLGISTTQTLNDQNGQMTIKWTPDERNVGDRIPFCFAAESDNGGTHYHSEMRCIILEVGQKIGDMNVICSPTTMKIEAARSFFPALDEISLSLLDPSCGMSFNDTHVFAITALDGCGTLTEEDTQNIIVRNEILMTEDPSQIITRLNEVEIHFSCSYPKRENLTAVIEVQEVEAKLRNRIAAPLNEDDFGTFSFQFELFHSNLFKVRVEPTSYPVEVRPSEMIFMEINATCSAQNSMLYVESCKAIPMDRPNHAEFYSIIENGCFVDETVREFPSQSNEFRFGVQAVNFLELQNVVYISCSVLLCIAGNPGTRCTQGCIPGNHRATGSVAGQTARYSVVQGPLRLKRSADDNGVRVSGTPSATIALHPALVAVVIVAAAALLCAVLVYKIRGNRRQITPVSHSDSDSDS